MFDINSSNSKNILENYLLSNSENVIHDPIFDFISEGVTLTDLKGNIVACNKAILKLHGFKSADELNGFRALDLVVENDRNRAEKKFFEIISSGELYNGRYSCLKSDGSKFSAEISSSLIKDKRGNPIGLWGITKDISEIETANEQLRLLVTALESAANEVVITDNNGEIIWVNSAFNNTTGYKDSEVIGKNPRILKSDYHSQEFYKNLWDTITNGNIWEGEIVNKKKNGELFTEYMTITPLENSDGKISNFIAIKENITQRKQVEQQLIESENKYRSLFENSTVGIYRADKKGNIIVANNRFLEILGLSSTSELEGVNLDSEYYVVPETRNKFFEILESEGKVYGFESKWKKKDGSIIYLKESATAFKKQNNDFEFYEGTIEDITDSILDKKEILKQANILKALRNSSELFLKDVDWGKNIHQVISEIGTAMEVCAVHLFSKKVDTGNDVILTQISGWNNSSNNLMPNELNLKNEGLLRWHDELIKNNIISGPIENLPESEKNYLAALGVKSVVLLPILLDGIVWGVLFVQSDNAREWNDNETEALRAATESIKAAIKRKKHEGDLIEAKRLAESADRTKSEFLAQMSHEIRTPLNNITSFNLLLKEQLENQIDEDIKGCFDVIDSASKRLIRTIGLILNLSELHTGSYKLVKNNFDLFSDLVNELYREYVFVAKQKNINFIINNNASNTLIYADLYSIEQIIKNLIDNAIKYTNSGEVKISLNNNSEGQIVLEISDTGIGISEEYLPNLFSPFSQEEVGYTRKFDGNGIGMTLVKEYCDLNKIIIDVKSIKNEGTTFTLTFNNEK